MPYRESQKPLELTIKLTVVETAAAVQAYAAKKKNVTVPESFTRFEVHWLPDGKGCIGVTFKDPKEETL